MRAVLDPNVIVSALLSPEGAPAAVLRAWQRGEYELVVSPELLGELERALAYRKLRARIDAAEARAVVAWLRDDAVVASDPGSAPSVSSEDPGDDYLVALAQAQRAVLVSGDQHLLALRADIPVFTAVEFLELLTEPNA